MYLCAWLFVFVALVTRVCSKHDGVGSDAKILKKILSGLQGSEDSVDSEDIDADLKSYFKHAAKKEEKMLKSLMREELSEEEKAEVKYYEDLLSKIKHVNDKKQISPQEEKADLNHLKLVLQQVRDMKRLTLTRGRG